MIIATQVWFKEKADQHRVLSKQLQGRYKEVSMWRVISFLVFVTLFIFSIQFRSMYLLGGSTAAFLLIFGVLVKHHNKIRARRLHHDLMSGLNEDEIDRLALRLGNFPRGKSYGHMEHPYSQDLDLFGQHSLFQWLNRTITPKGRDLLAHAMCNKSSSREIQDRQTAIKELSSNPDWMQAFMAGGLAYKDENSDLNPLLQWVANPGDAPLPAWYKLVLAVMPLLAFTALIGFFYSFLDFYFLFGALVINGLILKTAHKSASSTYEQTHQGIQILKAYQSLIRDIENMPFQSPLLERLQQPFRDQSYLASDAIEQLKNILSRIETRQNLLYWIFNIVFLLDLIWLIQAASWKAAYHSKVIRWVEAISNFEMLTSLAATSFANPELVFPEVTDHPFNFEAKALGHPLILPHERISNDFTLSGRGSIAILTGSNMSGKSTFLRTIGINAVLAFMGSPCCARTLHLGPFNLFTSMRTSDNLEQHISSFYAELKRLNLLITSLGSDQPTLFLLDEVLKGTNSNDRHRGATALIKQLSATHSFGLVSTHDLSLGKLQDSVTGISNFSFNSQLVDGELVFDYRLSPGICNSFNASELMAQMGIAIENDGDS